MVDSRKARMNVKNKMTEKNQKDYEKCKNNVKKQKIYHILQMPIIQSQTGGKFKKILEIFPKRKRR